MATGLASRHVSDLCIGKPPLRPLPMSATIGEALIALRRSGEQAVAVWAPDRAAFAGKVCMADIVCHLCSHKNVDSPVIALDSSVSDLLLHKPVGRVRNVDSNFSLLDCLDTMLEGTHNLVIPTSSFTSSSATCSSWPDFCWLSHEDFLRFFLDCISLFSSTAAMSITDLDIIRTDFHSVHRHEPALSALPFLELAMSDQTAVAVVTDNDRLISEISPVAIAGFDESFAAAFAALSAGDLAKYIRCGGGNSAKVAVRARLRDKDMVGMLELTELGLASALSSDSSSASSSTSGEEDSESEEESLAVLERWSGSTRATGRQRSEGLLVCRPESSLVAVMLQALAHRVSYLWVVEGEGYNLTGVVRFHEILGVFRDELL